ncbi:flagellar assembly protein FliW [Brevibacillus dissolubilis]|uniref:flagellar assembly protein FliW n=1 Tax=Brevibacillus dissolubilis TaxID=1844116 RepID=UPI001116A447|nr:flagellar assembly protein FliW [Brevibacillus dissolubilis]
MTSFKSIELEKLYFEEGVPGFSNLQFFQLLQEEPDSPFFVLQSIEEQTVSFWVINPFSFFREYEFDLPEQAKSALRMKEDSNIGVVNMATLRADNQITVNLKAPIIINMDNRMAKQVILHDEKFDIRQPLFQIPTKATSE